MRLVDRYIAEVGRHLPEKDRADIEAEIRSMVEDMLDERSQQLGKPVDDRLITDVLEQLGDPRLLAARYAPAKRYLIGPGWYEIYIKTLQRVLFTALPIIAVVMFVLTLTRNPLDFINAVGEAVDGVIDIGLQILFWTTLVFVFLERSDATPNESLSPDTRKWTVAQLPELPQKRQISTVETVMNIATILFVLIWIALPFTIARLEGNSVPVPFLHPNLWNFWLPVFFVLMGLTLVHEMFKLKVGNWTPALMTTNVILGLITIIYITALVITQDVINPAFLTMLDNAPGRRELREVIVWTINISAAIVAGIYVWDIVNSIRMARRLDKEKNDRTVSVQNMLAK
jgi:hypothetical protein